jgi:hypothetical protein
MDNKQPSVKELRNVISRIKNIVNILNSKMIFGSDNVEDYFYKNHPDIMNMYPFLVTQLSSGEDTSILDTMLEQLEKIENGEKTNNEAEVMIGKKLADTYIQK